ncbi:MAG: hypothetical protein ACRBN8_04760 [Nannocystales bacterium]
MNDPGEFDPIAASLRRQFSPPPLGALEQRIAEAAALQEAAAPQESEPETPVLEPESAVLPIETARPRGWTVGFAVAFAVAAAVLLLLARPWKQTEPSELDTPLIAKTPRPHEVVPPTSAARAGFQLHTFLSRGAALPSGEIDCEPPDPVERCSVEGGEPTLVEGGGVIQLGECGGSTGTDCGDFDLPADRALLVSYAPTGAQAIICIERSWTDPHPQLPPGSPYNIHRAEVGEFILYEITPLDQPQALDLVRL